MPKTPRPGQGIPEELAGLLKGLPDSTRGWTQSRRDKFLDAFGVVLNFVIRVREDVDDLALENEEAERDDIGHRWAAQRSVLKVRLSKETG